MLLRDGRVSTVEYGIRHNVTSNPEQDQSSKWSRLSTAWHPAAAAKSIASPLL
jgi:hypothetical protein